MTDQVHTFSRYLPVNNEALRWEIHCSDAGYAQVPAGTVYPPMPETHPKAYAATVTTGRVLREFQVVYNTNEAHANAAQTIREMWRRNLGVNVALVNNEG